MPKLPSEFEFSSKDSPDENLSTSGLGPDDSNGIRARWRALCLEAEGGNENAIKELFDIALRFSAEIDLDTETSLDRIVLASLITPIKYLWINEKARLASFGVTRDSNRPRSNRTEQRHIRIAEDIGSNLGAGYSFSEAIGKAADDNNVSEKTAQRAYKEFRLIAHVIKAAVERKARKP